MADGQAFDAIVIGTGFGGAVVACRLTQAGKSVCVLERGRRYGRGDFPRPATRPDSLPNTARWAWALDQGLWDVKDLQGTLAVQAAGYGGGSLVYANVHLRAPVEVFATRGREANGWPGVYSRKELDPYYDVVAAILRVRPLPPMAAPAAHLNGPPPKAEAMRDAARALGREQWCFLPPLAIDFDACVMCGECVVGCQFHAKNTLDLNYLPVAERLGADVRTLAEVTDVRQDDDGLYTVTYHDYIRAAKPEVRALSVFLCAGAVNSTHILLRSKDRLTMSEDSKKQIGARFFANGDAIAMVYDTTPAPTPTRGPTITRSLLYNKGALDLTGTRGDWFMIQDGGYPKFAEPALGLFRGDFWLQRNRIARGQKPQDRDAASREAAELTRLAEQTVRALLGVLDARYAFREGAGAGVLTSRFGPEAKPGARSAAAVFGLKDVLPPQLRDKLIPDARAFVHQTEKATADPVSHQTLAEIGRRLINSAFPGSGWFVKWLVGQIGERVEPHLVPSTLEVLHRYFLNAPENTAEPYTAAILWPLAVSLAQQLFLGRRPDDHAFLMLTMGVDAAPGRLYLDDDERLLAYWDLPGNAALSTMQERLMHDIAGVLAGEMRLNPDATARRRPVTVHSLGGCAMSDSPADGVTDPNGKVWGTRALYVLDGAAMPGSLGVNPSATIAAIAERNVRKALEDPASPIYVPTPVPCDPPLPGGPSLEEIRRLLGQTDAVLDPIADIPPTPAEPRAAAVGLKFKEVMQGFYTANGRENLPIRADLLAEIEDLSSFLVNPRRPIRITGTITLTPAPLQPQVVYDASGTLELLKQVQAIAALGSVFADGFARLQALEQIRRRPRTTSASVQAWKDAEDAMQLLLERLEAQPRRYEMDYDLKLTPRGGAGKLRRMTGVKKIYGGAGLAPWTETTTLHMSLYGPAPDPRVWTGTMHVHLADLLQTQLPSFEVTGAPDDDVRIAWAFARFFRFFLGTLRQVYLPNVEMLDPFGKG